MAFSQVPLVSMTFIRVSTRAVMARGLGAERACSVTEKSVASRATGRPTTGADVANDLTKRGRS